MVGVSLDQEAVLRIRDVTNSEISFITGNRVIATTLDGLAAGNLPGGPRTPGVFTVRLGPEEYVARIQPLDDDGRGYEPYAVVLRSRTEHLRFLPYLRWQIVLTGLAAVLIATIIGYLVTRTVTRPLRALTGAMSDMARTGDLTRALPALGRWDDEDVRLVATTFHQLTSAVEQFQREASLRDRLSSLGRLSTVVAHEIRNPLMIIKTAARRLRKHAAPEVVEVANSIDEEVVRLNRVVSGVLDFARPVQFSVASVDLSEVCHGAAEAAQAAGEGVPIEVHAERGLVSTDAERLRAVLVNLLTNAQHAVRARHQGAASTPPVMLRAGQSPAGRIEIVISDQGIGIAPEDLSKIFDPFFTTKRTGSGLGLPIAKNLVEGLGGALAVDSRWGQGTRVRIELPARPMPVESVP
jgi:signal transduction histidine kinase